jgi:hypothetical protein
MTKNRLVGAALFVLTLIPIVVVNYYPTGDWIGGPLLIFYFLVPLSVIQLGVLVLCFMKDGKAKGLIALEAGIALLCNALMFNYIRIH